MKRTMSDKTFHLYLVSFVFVHLQSNHLITTTITHEDKVHQDLTQKAQQRFNHRYSAPMLPFCRSLDESTIREFITIQCKVKTIRKPARYGTC